jgi:serine/threonine-protein kinase RsbW
MPGPELDGWVWRGMQVTSYYADSVLHGDIDLIEPRHLVTSDVQSRLRVPADLAAVSFVRSVLASMLARGEWPSGASGRVLLASTEALTNAIEHGSPPGASVRVDLSITPERADILVVDEGRPGVGVPEVPAVSPPPTATRGRGLIIMSRLADHLEVRAHGDGTQVSVLFIRSGGYAGGRVGVASQRVAAAD